MESKLAPHYKKICISVGALLVISMGVNIYLWNKVSVLQQNPTEINDKDLKDTTEKVSKLMIIPQDETPTLATVSDPEKLKDQPFFANAKTGFKVLVYTKAQKAILYDPFLNKIVEVAPINSNAPATSTSLIK